MSTELIAVIVAVGAVIVTALIEIVYLGAILRGMKTKMDADDATIFLQDKGWRK